MAQKLIDLTGKKYGRLTVLERAENHKVRTFDSDGCISRTHTYPMWRCKCDCGNEVVVYGHHLKSGNTVLCGCFRRESTKARFTKHGNDKG